MTIPLDSLLNPNETKERIFEGMTFRQIPFCHNEDYLASVGDDSATGFESATVLKKFYVTVDGVDVSQEYIVSMITRQQFAVFHPDFDYLYKANYSGVIIFSSLDGEVLEVRSYNGGHAEETNLLTKDEIESGDYQSLNYIKWYKGASITRSATAIEMDGGEIEGSICTGEHKPRKNLDDDPWPLDDVIPNLPSGGGGSGTTGNSDSTPGYGVRKPIQPIVIEYNYNLSTNLPQYIEMIGSDAHEEGSIVSISFSYKYLLLEIPFSMWTGGFHNKTSATFNEIATKNITSTAYFNYKTPCEDKEHERMNPLENMTIAATESGSYLKGTYMAFRGYKKDGVTPRYHKGVDFYAPIGSPVYSMYSGKVIRVWDDAPDENVNEPSGAFGNRIIIEYVVPGKSEKYYFQFSHLNYGTPIAINWRTNAPYKATDEVFAGDLIAFTGRTGNAWNDRVPNKHLDLMVSTRITQDGKLDQRFLLDPLDFINGYIDKDNLQRHPTDSQYSIVKGIICH